MVAVPWMVTCTLPRVTKVASAPMRAAFCEVVGMRSTVLPCAGIFTRPVLPAAISWSRLPELHRTVNGSSRRVMPMRLGFSTRIITSRSRDESEIVRTLTSSRVTTGSCRTWHGRNIRSVLPISMPVTAGLFPCPEFLFHLEQRSRCLFFTHARVLEPGEPFAHQVRALPAVREFLLVHAAVIDRAALNAGIRRPERFSLRCFAPGALVPVVVAPAAGVPADRFDLLCCHSTEFRIPGRIKEGFMRGESVNRVRIRVTLLTTKHSTSQSPTFGVS